MNARLAVPAAALALGLAPSPAAAQYRPTVGEPHPDITLPEITTGEPVSLASLRGRKVLLVHFASW